MQTWRSHTCAFCMHAHQCNHIHSDAHPQTHTNTKSHLQTDRHRHLASVWAEIILDQYNSVSEPKHKLGSCWKTLLHASSCLCVCLCVCARVCFWGLPDGNEPHRPRPSLPPSGFPVLCCSNWKRLLISHKLWLFTVTFPSSSSSHLPPAVSLSKVCPLSLFLTFGVVMLWVFQSVVFLLLQLSNRVSPHQNSWAIYFSRSSPNSPFCPQPSKGVHVIMRLWKVPRDRVSLFVTLKQHGGRPG